MEEELITEPSEAGVNQVSVEVSVEFRLFVSLLPFQPDEADLLFSPLRAENHCDY